VLNVFVCSHGYRPFLSAVQSHIAELQKCPTTSPSSVRSTANTFSRSNSVGASQADVSPTVSAATAASADNSLTPSRLDGKGDRRPELDSPSDVPFETRTESDSRCVVS